MQELDLGVARIRPKRPVVAGSFATIRFTYTAGHSVDDSGYLKIAFRFAGDFGWPQFDDPAAQNYCTVHTTGDCRILPRWDSKGNTRPWGYALYLKVTGGFLDSGQKITVVFGDRAHGSPGWQVQSFCEDTFEFKTLVDPIATYEFKELPESPTLRIVPGPPARAACIAPSRVTAGEKFTYHLKLEDRWGNPTGKPKKIRHAGFAKPRVERVSARDRRTGLSARSNPIDVVRAPGKPPLHPYWADFHGQSEETIGNNSIEDYFTFARDCGLVDIAGHQGNDFQVTDEFWRTVNRTTRRFYKPGRLVTFPGYEWSGNTPLGGDRNIYFVSEGGRIVHSCADLLPGWPAAYDIASTADELFRKLRGQKRPEAFAFAHVGGRYADLSMHDAKIELAVEVHSAWGTFEWLVEDALRRGYRIGICANSDGHKCRPGASYPGAKKFGSLGGLTCVLARRLDRRSVVEALRARHFYATTGNRCLVDVRLVAGDGRSAIMGDVIDAGAGTPRLHVRAAGTGPIESVEVRNGLETMRVLRPYRGADLGRRIKIVWSGAEVPGRARSVEWDGGLCVKGNTIVSVKPINFWNANQPLERIGRNQLAWKSVTTGGLAGMILTLARVNAGTLEMATAQRRVRCAIKTVGLRPRTWHCGGLRKKLEVYRLPDRQRSHEFSFSSPLNKLHEGDNPIYVRIQQEDGHMAWTSPVYLVDAQGQ